MTRNKINQPTGSGRGGQQGASPNVNIGRGRLNTVNTPTGRGGMQSARVPGPAGTQDNNSVCKGGPKYLCNNVVRDDEEGLQCDSCKQWFHAQCQNVTSQDYKFMQRLSPDVLTWYCNECKPGVSKLLSAVAKVNERCDKLEKDVDELKARVSDLEGSDEPDHVINLVRNECKQAFKEESDKLRRQSNIIIRGLQESTGGTDLERINEDKAKVLDICTTELGLKDNKVNIKGVFRLTPNASAASVNTEARPKLLKVILGSSEEKTAILRNAKKLASPTNPEYKVYISPDMTREERDRNRQLVDELLARRQESRDKNENCKWAIKRNEVIKVGPINQGNSA